MHQSYNVIIITLLIAFAIYRRIRRNIGFQKLSPKRMRVRMVIFLVLCALLLAISVVQPLAYFSDAVGIAIGLVLSYFAGNTTKFEVRKERWYFRPNSWIGGIVLLLFIGRVAFRLVPFYEKLSQMPKSAASQTSFQTQPFGSNPWTAGLIFIFIAYYVGYYWFLLRKERNLPEASSAH